MGKKAPKATAIVPYNPKARKTIYKVNHHTTKLPIYVGQTFSQSKRTAGHAAAVIKELDRNRELCLEREPRNLMVRYVKECQDKGFPLNLVVLPEFLDGVPADRANGFEAYMIFKLKTASACGTGGKNTSCGNHLGTHEEKFPEYKKELKKSGGVYVWSAADVAMRDAVAPEVVAAQGQLAGLQDLQTMMREGEGDFATLDLDTQVSNALVVVDDAMRKYMGPLQLAEALADKYEAHLGVLPVNGDEFEVDLNALRDSLIALIKHLKPDLDELKDLDSTETDAPPLPEEDVLALCRSASLMTKRPVPASFVSHLFRALAGAMEAIEEAKLPECDEVDMMKEVRKMLATTGEDWLRGPQNNGASVEEGRLHIKLMHWKANVYKIDASIPHVAAMRFLLRSNSTWVKRFDDWILYDAAAKSDQINAQLNAMLLQGYAHPNEPDFNGKKKWPGGADGTDTAKLHTAMRNLANCIAKGGKQITQTRIDIVLKGLDENRAKWWRAPTGLACQNK